MSQAKEPDSTASGFPDEKSGRSHGSHEEGCAEVLLFSFPSSLLQAASFYLQWEILNFPGVVQ